MFYHANSLRLAIFSNNLLFCASLAFPIEEQRVIKEYQADQKKGLVYMNCEDV
jgi:hypothetical protein